MIRTDFRLAAVAALALGLSGTAALARTLSHAAVPAQADAVAAPAEVDTDAFAAPAVVVARPVAVVETAFVPPNVMGQFTCAFNERHTRLERQACGATSYRYGRVAD